MSPMVRSIDRISIGLPSRITIAFGELIFFKAANALLALCSCTTPRTALSITIAKIINPSTNPSCVIIPITIEIAAAINNIITKKSLN